MLDLITSRLDQDLVASPTSIVDGDVHAYPRKCLHEIFSEQAKAMPDALALIQHDRRYTYRELDEETDALARWLVANGVGPRDLVGILMERCTEHVVALIAINKAGAIFMPLDIAYPPETMERFVRVSEARVFLTMSKWVDPMPGSLRALCSWVCLEGDWQTRLAIDEGVVGRTIRELDDVLEGGDPAVAVFADAANGAIWLNPQHLEDGEEELVAERERSSKLHRELSNMTSEVETLSRRGERLGVRRGPASGRQDRPYRGRPAIQRLSRARLPGRPHHREFVPRRHCRADRCAGRARQIGVVTHRFAARPYRRRLP